MLLMSRTVEDIWNKINNSNRENTTYFHPIVSYEEIAKFISAYSNSNGGDIIFGIKDDGVKLTVKKFAFNLDLKHIQNLIEGSIKIKYNNLLLNGNNIFYISIDKSNDLVKVNNIPYKISKYGELEEMMIKKVFISYSHKDSDLVDILESELDRYNNIEITRDINITKYRDSLEEFMKTIREHDFTIAVVSSAYIMSLNCMYEVMQLMQDKNYQEKLFFIIVNSNDEIYYNEKNRYNGFEANIYDVENRIKYLAYWENKRKKLNQSIECANLPVESMSNLALDVRKLNSIIPTMDDFINTLSDKVGKSFKDMYENDFKELVDLINK